MEIYEKNGLDFRKDTHEDFLINPNERGLELIKKLNIKSIEINDSIGIIPNLNFLKEHNFIERIAIVTFKEIDVTPIQNLKNLSLLRLTRRFNQNLDFDSFSKLKICQIDWSNKFRNLGKLKLLETLFISNFKKEDLAELKDLTSLKVLSLIKSSVRTLAGLEPLKFLEQLDLMLLRNLSSLKGIEDHQCLKRIDIESCHVKDLEPLTHLTNLEILGIHNGRTIDSLKPIRALGRLSIIYLTGSTNIIDGDMSPLIGRKDACFGPRRHYSHTPIEVDELNGTVRPKQTWEY